MSDLDKIINKRFQSYQPGSNTLWNAQSYNLHNARFCKNFTEENESIILKNLQQARLTEAIHIENFGMEYGAKMVLASEDSASKKVYCMIANDEAVHLHAIEQFVDFEISAEKDPFITLLGDEKTLE